MIDLNTLRRIQALGPNYMADPGQLEAPGDLTSNPLAGLSPDPNQQQQNPLAGLQAQAQQQGVQPPPLATQAPQQQTYQGSPITGYQQPPSTPASLPQMRVPDTTAATGGLAGGPGGTNINMMNRPRPMTPSYQITDKMSGLAPNADAGGPGASVGKGTSGLMPDPVTAQLESLMAPGNTPAYDEYQKQLMNPPNEANFKHSKLRNVMAAMAGLSGNPMMTDYIQNMPYEKAKGDYQERLKNLQGGATEEEKMISNKRGIATAAALDQIKNSQINLAGQKMQATEEDRQREYDRKVKDFEATNNRLNQAMLINRDNAQAMAEIQRQRAENAVQFATWTDNARKATARETAARDAATDRFHQGELADSNRRADNAEKRTAAYVNYLKDIAENPKNVEHWTFDADGTPVYHTETTTTHGNATAHTRQQAVDWLKSHQYDSNNEKLIQNMMKEQNWPK